MGSKALRGRENWQTQSGKKGGKAELQFFEVLQDYFAGSKYSIREKPREFKDIYSNIELDQDTLRQIYNPNETWVHGIIPDYAIDNFKSKKTIYTEVKSQDGWVEGKERKAGRGNVHERSNKFFTPGLQRILREKGNISKDVLPFWVVFQGDIARDPKRVREISLWYEGIEGHFLLWHDSTNPKQLLDHFDKHIAPILE
jgi:hypothetical protein